MTASAIALQFPQGLCRLRAATFAFERERQSGKSEDERSAFARHLRNNRRRTGASSPAQPGANENHPRALQDFAQFVSRFVRRVVTQLGIARQRRARASRRDRSALFASRPNWRAIARQC